MPLQAKRGWDTKIPQSGGPPEKVGDEAVHKELGDRVERAATTATSLDAEQDSGNITKTQSTTMSNDPLSKEIGSSNRPMWKEAMGVSLLRLGGYIPRSDKGRPDLHELMAICIKLSDSVLDLEKEKDAQVVEILKLKNIIKKLERKAKSSIPPPKRRLYKQVDSSDDSLGKENASKQGRNDSNKIEELNLSDKGSGGTEKDVNAASSRW
ncbi:hypothetical protein Tco_0369527 [Tanacetum coccineum]